MHPPEKGVIVVEKVALVAVVVTDKNGRTSRRWKRPDNVKPSDVVIVDELEMPKLPAARISARTVARPPTKRRKNSSVHAVDIPPVLSWDVDDVLMTSGISTLLASAAASFLPFGTLVSSAALPSRVDFLVTDVFGYESVIVVDFEKCVTIVARDGVPCVDIDPHVDPAIFRLEGSSVFGFGEKRLSMLLVMAWNAVAESRVSVLDIAV